MHRWWIDPAEKEAREEASDEPCGERLGGDGQQVHRRGEDGGDREQQPRVHPLREVEDRREQRPGDEAELDGDREPRELAAAEPQLVAEGGGDSVRAEPDAQRPEGREPDEQQRPCAAGDGGGNLDPAGGSFSGGRHRCLAV